MKKVRSLEINVKWNKVYKLIPEIIAFPLLSVVKWFKMVNQSVVRLAFTEGFHLNKEIMY